VERALARDAEIAEQVDAVGLAAEEDEVGRRHPVGRPIGPVDGHPLAIQELRRQRPVGREPEGQIVVALHR
jgi:hypothetical protein